MKNILSLTLPLVLCAAAGLALAFDRAEIAVALAVAFFAGVVQRATEELMRLRVAFELEGVRRAEADRAALATADARIRTLIAATTGAGPASDDDDGGPGVH